MLPPNSDMDFNDLILKVAHNPDNTLTVSVLSKSSSYSFDLVSTSDLHSVSSMLTPLSPPYTLGLVQLVTPIYTTFAGQTVDANSILVKYALNGDLNWDGIVNFDDYYTINQGFVSAGAKTGYFWGDVNYDGKINFDDYWLMNHAYYAQAAPAQAAPLAAVARPKASPAKVFAHAAKPIRHKLHPRSGQR
jgi:hypothetical protein